MHTGFVHPGCTYNIVLSEDDLKCLLEKGYISFDPARKPNQFRNECGISHNVDYHGLSYSEKDFCSHIQFIGIGLENFKKEKGEYK